MTTNPIRPFLGRQRVLILDGGLATELEARGADLGDATGLWSARLLRADPDLIRDVHLAYLEAGADCIIGASYQATVAGFVATGLDEAQAVALIGRSVELAREARDLFWSRRDRPVRDSPARDRPGRLRPLVAASVGPYGAYLADGSEYTGAYDLDEEGLVAFHRRRFAILAASGADLLACETVPSLPEARALARLLRGSLEVRAWVSFSCRDERHLADGTELAAAVAEVADLEQVVAVGINCIPPSSVAGLIAEVRRVSDKAVVVYPNSGESYDAAGKRWLAPVSPLDWAAAAERWHVAGASLLGGCCRSRPAHIRRIRERLVDTAGEE